MPFRIGGQQMPCLGNLGLVPDRRHHILQRALVRGRIVHVVGREQTEPICSGQRIEPLDPRNVVTAVEVAGGDMAQCGKPGCKMRQQLSKLP